jgi:hypothetical protein
LLESNVTTTTQHKSLLSADVPIFSSSLVISALLNLPLLSLSSASNAARNSALSSVAAAAAGAADSALAADVVAVVEVVVVASVATAPDDVLAAGAAVNTTTNTAQRIDLRNQTIIILDSRTGGGGGGGGSSSGTLRQLLGAFRLEIGFLGAHLRQRRLDLRGRRRRHQRERLAEHENVHVVLNGALLLLVGGCEQRLEVLNETIADIDLVLERRREVLGGGARLGTLFGLGLLARRLLGSCGIARCVRRLLSHAPRTYDHT